MLKPRRRVLSKIGGSFELILENDEPETVQYQLNQYCI